MEKEELDNIIVDRFELWRKRLHEQTAVPTILIGMDLKTKTPVVCIPNDPKITNDLVSKILRLVSDKILKDDPGR